MLGQKEKQFTARVVSLEQLVPLDNFYHQLEAKLDLSFVYDLVKDCYASSIGRPSIDPVVFFKLQLIMFFEGIRSERQLMEPVNLNLAYRWYIGYDLDEPVPGYSSLSKIRDRYGLVVFERFFEGIIELCQAAGLVWGQALYFDGTKSAPMQPWRVWCHDGIGRRSTISPRCLRRNTGHALPKWLLLSLNHQPRHH